MHCPHCTFSIAPRFIDGVEVDHCTRCEGTFFDPGEAPRVFGEAARFDTWRELWVTSEATPTALRCPKDGRSMQAHTIDMTGKMPNDWSLSPSSVVIDVCPHCNG